MEHHGPISLIPVVLTIGLALLTRQVVTALFIGAFSGVLLLAGGNPFVAATTMVSGYLVPQLTDSYNAGVLVLLAFIGGFVALMEQSGGASALAALAVRLVHSRARAQRSAWLGGCAIFFSGPLQLSPQRTRMRPRSGYGSAKDCRPFDNCTTMYCLPRCMYVIIP